MHYIKGNIVNSFVDAGVTVQVYLNKEKSTHADNAMMAPPRLLANTVQVGSGNNIGNAVVCQAGSHIVFSIASDKGIAGFAPTITTGHETITKGIFASSETRYGPASIGIARYSDVAKTIRVNDFGKYDKTEGFQRANVNIDIVEVTSFVRDGVHYPKAGVQAGVKPGSLDKGTDTDRDFTMCSDVNFGNSIAGLQMMFFVVDGRQAMHEFAEELRGVSAEDW